MVEIPKCPYCNQPLASSEAVEHLHNEEEKLRRKLADDANAEASRKFQESLAKAERERSKKERALQQTIEDLQKQKENLERKSQDELAAKEKEIREELEGRRSKHEQALQLTIDLLQKQNEDLENRLSGLNAPQLGGLNEADIANDLIQAFPEDEIT